MKKSPLVSVIMSVFNGAKHLRQTVMSVLNQTHDDFEFIIVNDGSTDESADELDRLKYEDRRIQIVHQENCGLTKSLNRALSVARGNYIARQDVGDLSLPRRFEIQVRHLDSNQGVVATGCTAIRIGPEDEPLGIIFARTESQILDDLMQRRQGICHAAAMIRMSALRNAGFYRTSFRISQDIDLWYRLSNLGRLSECHDPLFQVRIETGGISATNFERQSQLAALAFQSYQNLSRGRSDSEILQKVEYICASVNRTGGRCDSAGAGAYLIGSELYQNRDRRSIPYLWRAFRLRHRPIRAALKLLLSACVSYRRLTIEDLVGKVDREC